MAGGAAETGGFLEHILGSLASIDELAEAAAPGVPAQQLRVLMQFSHNESLLAALGASKEVSTAQNTCMPFRWSGAQHAQPVCRTAHKLLGPSPLPFNLAEL